MQSAATPDRPRGCSPQRPLRSRLAPSHDPAWKRPLGRWRARPCRGGGRGRSARRRRWRALWSSSDEPLYSGDELSGVVTVGLVQALVEPSVEKGEPRSVESSAGRRELGQHLTAGGALGDHPLAAADLTFDRSEEHTSELQSLMRLPYAVF